MVEFECKAAPVLVAIVETGQPDGLVLGQFDAGPMGLKVCIGAAASIDDALRANLKAAPGAAIMAVLSPEEAFFEALRLQFAAHKIASAMGRKIDVAAITLRAVTELDGEEGAEEALAELRAAGREPS